MDRPRPSGSDPDSSPTTRSVRPAVRVRVREWAGDDYRDHEDRIAGEEPLEIRLAWPGSPARSVVTTMRTPGHDFELAAGWCLHEGLAAHDAIRRVAYCTDASLAPEEAFNTVTVDLAARPERPVRERYVGPTAGSAACGVCGARSIAEALAPAAVLPSARWAGLVVSPQVVADLPSRLRDAQQVFDRTGGVHAAGLFTADGEPVVVREDVGRHNAVDKVAGARLLGADPAVRRDAPLLALSGRIGYELVQKAVVSGVAIVVAVGAPSSLAVDLARRAGVTLAGFVRDGRVVVYTGEERLGV